MGPMSTAMSWTHKLHKVSGPRLKGVQVTHIAHGIAQDTRGRATDKGPSL